MLLALFVVVFKTVQMGKTADTIISFIASFINRSGFFDGLRQGSCIIVSFSAGALLFAVTTTSELRDSLGRLENTITGFFTHKKQKQIGTAPAGKLSLGISLMLGFLPRFFELWESANLACEGRAGKKGFSRIVLLVPLVTERMMEMASETALALEGRGFTA
jgi:biotin transport system permease protein